MNIFDHVQLFHEIVQQFALADIAEPGCLGRLTKVKQRLRAVKADFHKANQILLTVLHAHQNKGKKIGRKDLYWGFPFSRRRGAQPGQF